MNWDIAEIWFPFSSNFEILTMGGAFWDMHCVGDSICVNAIERASKNWGSNDAILWIHPCSWIPAYVLCCWTKFHLMKGWKQTNMDFSVTWPIKHNLFFSEASMSAVFSFFQLTPVLDSVFLQLRNPVKHQTYCHESRQWPSSFLLFLPVFWAAELVMLSTGFSMESRFGFNQSCV